MNSYFIYALLVLAIANISGCSKYAGVSLTEPDGFSFKYKMKIYEAYMYDSKESSRLMLLMKKSGKPFLKDDDQTLHIYIIKYKNQERADEGYYIRLQTRRVFGQIDSSRIRINNHDGHYSVSGYVASKSLDSKLKENIKVEVSDVAVSALNHDQFYNVDVEYFSSILHEHFNNWFE